MLPHPRRSSGGFKGYKWPVGPQGAHRNQGFERLHGCGAAEVSLFGHFLMSLNLQISVYNQKIHFMTRVLPSS